jgi:hypothetical protein
MEFTKLSESDRWLDRSVVSPPRRGTYHEFPEEKQGGDVRTRVASSARLAPLLHLRRRQEDGIFDNYLAHLDDVWATAVPIAAPGDAV